MTLLRAWLELMRQSELWSAAVLRGSQLTARWVPGRRAADLDFLLTGSWTLERAARACGVLAQQNELPFSGHAAGLGLEARGIWLETPWPGLRLLVTRGAEQLQVDFGWDEVLGVPPRPFELEGFTLPSVAPEVMFGWKVHSLVELGPRGRWHPKTLIDLVLIARHCALDPDATRRCIESAFASRNMPLSQLDDFFHAPDWGNGRSSRHKWKKYLPSAPWTDFTREQGIAEARHIVGRFLGVPVVQR